MALLGIIILMESKNNVKLSTARPSTVTDPTNYLNSFRRLWTCSSSSRRVHGKHGGAPENTWSYRSAHLSSSWRPQCNLLPPRRQPRQGTSTWAPRHPTGVCISNQQTLLYVTALELLPAQHPLLPQHPYHLPPQGIRGPAVQSGETGESGLGEMAIKLRSGASQGFRIPAELEERCVAWGRWAEELHSH